MTLNKVMLIGNVGKDPEVRHLENNLTYASFTLATTERYKDRSGELKDATEWHNVVCWRNLAELADKYIRKGSQLYIEGKLKTRSWDDANGQKRYTTEILAENIRLLGKRADESNMQKTQSGAFKGTSSMPAAGDVSSSPSSSTTPEDSDDLPF